MSTIRTRDSKVVQGRYRKDYDKAPRVYDIQPGSNNVAQKKFGKAGATLCFHSDKSSWGMVKNNEAAILIFETNRFEPTGFKLSELTVEVRFSKTPPDGSGSSNAGIKLYSRPSPRLIEGGETSRSKETEVTLEPNVNVAGASASASIGHYTSKSTYEQKKHWRYSSYWKSSEEDDYDDRAFLYDTAGWIWKANAHNSELENISDFYGGAVVLHSGREFYVSSKVDGRLAGPMSILHAARRRFRFQSDKKAPYFRLPLPADGQTDDIEPLAADLDAKMTSMMKGALAQTI